MTIHKILTQYKGTAFSSNNAHMHEQTPDTLLFWILGGYSRTINKKRQNGTVTLTNILNAKDWEFDNVKQNNSSRCDNT